MLTLYIIWSTCCVLSTKPLEVSCIVYCRLLLFKWSEMNSISEVKTIIWNGIAFTSGNWQYVNFIVIKWKYLNNEEYHWRFALQICWNNRPFFKKNILNRLTVYYNMMQPKRQWVNNRNCKLYRRLTERKRKKKNQPEFY